MGDFIASISPQVYFQHQATKQHELYADDNSGYWLNVARSQHAPQCIERGWIVHVAERVQEGP